MENENRHMNHRKNTTAHLLLGIFFVILGLGVLAEIVDAVDWNMSRIIFSWQMILIILGIVFISKRENRSAGYVLLAIGAFFLMPKVFDVPHFWRDLFWPTILILVGVLIIFKRGGKNEDSSCRFRQSRSSLNEDYLDGVDFFSGGDRIVRSQNFKGGKLTHVFGGSNYDFRQAKLAPGVNYLEVVNVFGGSKFYVPEDWDIRIEVTSVFGGYSDKRHRSIIVVNSESQLVITGVNIFGGGELAYL